MEHQKPFVDFTLISVAILWIFIFKFESGLPSLGLLLNTVSYSFMVTCISVWLCGRHVAWWESQDIHEIIASNLSPKTSICPWSGPHCGLWNLKPLGPCDWIMKQTLVGPMGSSNNGNPRLCSDKCYQGLHEWWRGLSCQLHAAGVKYVRWKF